MLTRNGVVVAVAAVALVAAGRLFGLVELYVCGAATGLLLVICLAWSFLTRLDLGAGRALVPQRVHAGSPARANIRVRNLREARTPVLRLVDPVSGTSGADLLLSPLRGGEVASIAYRLPTERRGVVAVGPLDVVVNDPFGLTAVRTRATGRAELTVFPRVDRIDPPRQAAGPDPTSSAANPSALGRAGDEFYALRPYVVGDDLRRVHWASTARTGDLVVRQDELPWQGRTTVLLDQRRGSYDLRGFEAAVSAAASILDAAWRRGDLVRLATTEGDNTAFGSGHAHLTAIFEQLAVIRRSNRSDVGTATRAIERSPTNGALIVVSGDLRTSERTNLKRAAAGFGRVQLVSFSADAEDAVPGLEVLRIAPGAAFAATWQAAHARPTIEAGAAR